MRLRSRVFGFAVLAGFTASALLLFLQALGDAPWHRVIRSLMTPNGLLEFGFLLVVAVLPASLPMTLVGGYIAARVTAQQRYSHPFRFWITRGCGTGLGLGALGSVFWFGGINLTYMWDAGWNVPPIGMVGPGRRELLTFVSFVALLGGLAGTLWVAWSVRTAGGATRRLPPSNEMQLSPAQVEARS